MRDPVISRISFFDDALLDEKACYFGKSLILKEMESIFDSKLYNIYVMTCYNGIFIVINAIFNGQF